MTGRRPSDIEPVHYREPVGYIIEQIAQVESALDPVVIAQCVESVADNRRKLRELAQSLFEFPGLLISGEPNGSRLVEYLVIELKGHGARRVALPHCARCGRVRPLLGLNKAKKRICASCQSAELARSATCSVCGKHGKVMGRDRDGQPLCKRCVKVSYAADYRTAVVAHLTALKIGIAADAVNRVLDSVLPQPYQQREVSWILDKNPSLLSTNAASSGSHRLVLLAEALIRAGADDIAEPSCPLCGAKKPIRNHIEGTRCCRQCYERSQKQPCSRCGRIANVVVRNHKDEPICAGCYRLDPLNHEPCTECGRPDLIRHREPSTGQRYCGRCWRGQLATCVTCGRTKPCPSTRQGFRCADCVRRANAEPCAECGRVLAVWSRTQSGAAVCSRCTRMKAKTSCSQCRNVRIVIARVDGEPFCKFCYRKHPASFRECESCGRTERLHHFGKCASCVADLLLHDLLGDDRGVIPAGRQRLYEALSESTPRRLIAWITESPAVPPFRQLLSSATEITHESLDALLPNRAIDVLRCALVTAGMLPVRDERLATLERWLLDFLPTIGDLEERRLLERYSRWTHLRRLRRKSAVAATSMPQIGFVRGDLSRARTFLNWLHTRDTRLVDATAADIDKYLTIRPEHRSIATFINWARRHGYPALPHVAPPLRSTPRDLIAEDERWRTVQRLLHDTDLHASNRLAGLLVLLYAQRPSRIVQLSTDDISVAETVTLKLGREPLHLPPQIGDLIVQLTTRRENWVQIAVDKEHPWLFPGALPGTHLSAAHLSERLNRLGIRTRLGRNSALINLAVELPSSVLAGLLGIDIATATTWRAVAGARRAMYASEITQRVPKSQKGPDIPSGSGTVHGPRAAF
ncbi:site-specific recombinase XerD [Mycobacteroides abscessus subsp. abscessus]|nr:site-specific recombinase XerD [Mycobacteroides abscessus subsp. abscessus]SHU29088.1 site-specific recombinase XerD [Mycobacteroides abscessus subsp. abscessus]SHV34737.1 site-specific recombinase XerD [Mycobacteroides abscessus subsp. abscessus]SHV73645.1 site-specific recombinase XerD [Mycobacteroides abscessus subsp. abscessus]SHX95601.1 site-specific recombinase XerD [Mycobacteroides abscessus subsp. abscessus]